MAAGMSLLLSWMKRVACRTCSSTSYQRTHYAAANKQLSPMFGPGRVLYGTRIAGAPPCGEQQQHARRE
eukprot:1440103-Prymnesium_polylepis.1